MPFPKNFDGLALPAIAAPMFLISNPDLVVEICRSGLVDTFPALNQRTTEGFEAWMEEIKARPAQIEGAAPWGVNPVVHKTNARMRADLDAIVRHKVPLVITSLGAVRDVVDAVHSCGGLVFHDVISRRHAEKASEAGVDGIIAVCSGAGGHSGTLSPFAFVREIRSFFSGTIAVPGSISDGGHIAAVRAMGADMAYMGTRFIATREASVDEGYRQMILIWSATGKWTCATRKGPGRRSGRKGTASPPFTTSWVRPNCAIASRSSIATRCGLSRLIRSSADKKGRRMHLSRPGRRPHGLYQHDLLLMGDFGRVVGGCYLEITGRKKGIITRKGENISPLEIENVLARHPGVRRCAIVGDPDAERGEMLVAFVVTHDGKTFSMAEMTTPSALGASMHRWSGLA